MALQVGVIGCGYWGPNVIRNFDAAPGARVAMVADLRPDRRDFVAQRFRGVRVTADAKEILGSREVDAVAICTPPETHFEIAREALARGKHVFVEKPITTRSAQAAELVQAARAAGRVLMVDHTFLYTGAVRAMRAHVGSGALGEALYFDSVRINLGAVQREVNVLWDLAPHDLAIFHHLVGAPVSAVRAFAASHVPGRPASMGILTLECPGGIVAHFHVNWLAPTKVRHIILCGRKTMVIWNDMLADEKVKVYDAGIEVPEARSPGAYAALVGYRLGDVRSPRLETREALETEVAHFLDCVKSGARPISDGEAGLAVVRILEAADASLARGGERVTL